MVAPRSVVAVPYFMILPSAVPKYMKRSCTINERISKPVKRHHAFVLMLRTCCTGLIVPDDDGTLIIIICCEGMTLMRQLSDVPTRLTAAFTAPEILSDSNFAAGVSSPIGRTRLTCSYPRSVR